MDSLATPTSAGTKRHPKNSTHPFLAPPLDEFRPPVHLAERLANVARGRDRSATVGSDLWSWQRLSSRLAQSALNHLARDWNVAAPSPQDRAAPFTYQLAVHSIPFMREYSSWNAFPRKRRREAALIAHVLDVQDRCARGGNRLSQLNVCKLLAHREVGMGINYKSGESLLDGFKKVRREPYWQFIKNALGDEDFVLFMRLLVNGTSEAPPVKLSNGPGKGPKIRRNSGPTTKST